MIPAKKNRPAALGVPTYASEPQVQYLSQLLDEVKVGGLLIPRFQREFVWRDDQRLDLLRSVLSGIPIGSILVWRTSEHALDTFKTIGPHPVPRSPEPTPGPPRTYLLDGHQRLSTLFGALVFPQDDEIKDEESASKRDWGIYYDLEKKDFVLRGNKNVEPTWLPTNILMDSLKLIRFQRQLSGNFVTEEYIQRTDQVANAFRNYKIPVIPIVTDNLEAVTTAFQRINSSGTPMSDVHMVSALTYKTNFDLEQKLFETKEKLAAEGWGSFDAKYVLATIRARLDLNISSPDAKATSANIKTTPGLVEEAADNLVLTAKFLKSQCGIPSPELLPYSYQAVLLAEAMRRNSSPNAQVSRLLSDWLWYTTYTGFFLGARDNDVKEALEEVRRLADGHIPLFDSSNREKVESLPRRFDFRSARSKALILRLAELNPKSPAGGNIKIEECFRNAGSESVVQLISARLFPDARISGPENRFIVPPNDAAAFRRTLLPAGAFLLCEFTDNFDFLKSHAISPEASVALSREDYGSFLDIRRATLIGYERDFVTRLNLDYSST